MDLFSVESDFIGKLDTKPRKATEREVKAYTLWMRERLGLADFQSVDLHFAECRNGRRYERGHCIGATFGRRLEQSRWIQHDRWEDGQKIPGIYQHEVWENGAYSLIMPGHNMHRQAVTFEALDEAGEVLASQTLPVEPKKCGVIWSREDVRKAAGKVSKVKASPIPVHVNECPEITAPVGAESEAEPCPALDSPEHVEALSAPEMAPATDKESLTVEPDALAALAERVAALEAALASLSVESGAGVITAPDEGVKTTQPPIEEIRPKRTAAHERAIRRAWAERKAARLQRKIAADHMHMREQVQEELRRESRASEQLRAQYDNAVKSRNSWKAEAEAANQRERVTLAKRRRSTMLARYRGQQMVHMASLFRDVERQGEFQRQRAEVLAAQLASLKASLADPTSPERESDLHRLKTERDQARNALAAVEARSKRQQAMLDQCAAQIEALAGRVAGAESALRQSLTA
jgi:hypothetical protein